MSTAGDSEGPPSVVDVTEHDADDLRARHPVWRNSVAGSQRADAAAASRFERLSNFAIEMEVFRAANEGAESDIFSDAGTLASKSKHQHSSRAEDYELSDSDLGSDVCSQQPNKRARRRSSAYIGNGGLSAVAFGIDPRAQPVEDDASCFSDTASERLSAMKKSAFPCKGVECVGCALAGRISPVSKFISENIGRMSEQNLFKLAAVRYKQDIVVQCQLEGITAPPWNWKDIHTHYALHVTDETIARTSTIRLLQNMRYHAESRLVRVKGSEKELDKQGSDMILKIVAAESKERALLQSYLANPGPRGRPTVGELE
jgi:hypothetical protein